MSGFRDEHKNDKKETFKSLYGCGGRSFAFRYVCMAFEPRSSELGQYPSKHHQTLQLYES